jgi:glycolate oxidase iron-sulfur subunit
VNTAAAPQPFIDEDKSLACVHCGLCLSSCPTYLETGNENDSPRGRIYLMRAIQSGRLPLSETAVRHIDLCLGCRACESACPSGVQYGDLLEHTRDHIEGNYRRSFFQRLLRRVVIEKIFPHATRMKLALIPARIIRWLGADRLLPKFAGDALSLMPSNPTEATLPEMVRAAQPSRGRVGFVRGCVMNVLFGETHQSSIWLLNRAGYDVVTPREQVCCGALFAHGGNLAAAREYARRNIAVFEKLEVEAIIINAAGCGSTLKDYGHLLDADPEWAARARNFSNKVKDLTEWLPLIPKQEGRGTSDGGKVTYHDACHLAHPQRITRQPRELLKSLVGEAMVEMPESDVCCGSAGSYNLTEPAMAERLQDRKIGNILKTGARTVVTTNPGCILQIRAGLRKAGLNHIEVVHLADYIASRLRDS